MSTEERRLKRTERLFKIILLLQNRPSMTSKDLAEYFGVSRRTVFRDLRTLSDSGVPLTYGDEGGYEILEGYQLPPLMLSAREAATLLTGVAFMKMQPDASLSADADQVGLKIRSVLPRDLKDYIDRLQARTIVDPYWLSASQPDEMDEGRWHDVSDAIARQRSLLITYHTPSRGETTRRRVDPLGLVYYTDHWNLIGFDHLRADIRNFRFDRIEELTVTSEPFEPPAGFDLERFLTENAGEAQQLQRVAIRFKDDVFRRVRRSLPARIVSEERDGDWVTVRFEFENLPYLAGWLLRHGDAALVEEPAALQALVVEEAKRITALY